MNAKRQRPYVVGLTGGVASGKSAVARCFEKLGVPVIDTDRLARHVVQPGSDALREIAEAFGAELIGDGGELDRPRMRERIFTDANARMRLEAILHPRIAERLDAELQEIEAPYCVVAVPLLVESGWVGRFDRVLVVDAPESVQVDRLLDRDDVDRENARRMLDAQAGREERLRVADDVLDNSGSLEELEAAVEKLHAAYSAYAAKSA